MSEQRISITEAAGDFEAFMARLEAAQEPTTFLREGQPVARIIPLPAPADDYLEAIRRWEQRERLPPEEAEAFANDLEEIHSHQPPPTSAWD